MLAPATQDGESQCLLRVCRTDMILNRSCSRSTTMPTAPSMDGDATGSKPPHAPPVVPRLGMRRILRRYHQWQNGYAMPKQGPWWICRICTWSDRKWSHCSRFDTDFPHWYLTALKNVFVQELANGSAQSAVKPTGKAAHQTWRWRRVHAGFAKDAKRKDFPIM